nr:hypothetical protein [Tanacetum cinerariifolium]GEY94732.1 hypothetical protein [Tanacetum cinerariifolium]
TESSSLSDSYSSMIGASVHTLGLQTTFGALSIGVGIEIVNKELVEYINSPSWDRPIFFNDNEDHFVQYKEYLENPSNEIVVLNSNQQKEKSPQDSDIHHLIREKCFIEFCKKQKQNMEDTMIELIEVFRQKEFYCMHNNVDDLIESALNSKLLSINLESQRLDKKKQEFKNVIEQPTKCETHIAKSLKNFRVKKISISLNNTSQISLVHAITPVLPTEEPEYSLSMGYEHLSIIPETESDEVTESSAKNLLPIPSEYEVTSDDESVDDESLSNEDVPMEDFKVYSNPFFNDDEINSNEIDPHCLSVKSDFVESLSNRDTLIDSFPKFDFLEEFSSASMPTSVADEERIRRDHEEYINELLPPSIERDDYDSERDINVLEVLLVDDSIFLPENESFYFDHHDNPSFPCPYSELLDVEFFFDSKPEVILAVMNNNDELNEDECFDPGGEIDVFTNVKDDDSFPSCLSFEFFYHILSILRFLLYFSPLRVKTSFLTLASPFRAGGISLGWKSHVLLCLS